MTTRHKTKARRPKRREKKCAFCGFTVQQGCECGDGDRGQRFLKPGQDTEDG